MHYEILNTLSRFILLLGMVKRKLVNLNEYGCCNFLTWQPMLISNKEVDLCYFCLMRNCILVPKLFWPTVEKNVLLIEKNFWNSGLKAKNLQRKNRSLEQFYLSSERSELFLLKFMLFKKATKIVEIFNVDLRHYVVSVKSTVKILSILHF